MTEPLFHNLSVIQRSHSQAVQSLDHSYLAVVLWQVGGSLTAVLEVVVHSQVVDLDLQAHYCNHLTAEWGLDHQTQHLYQPVKLQLEVDHSLVVMKVAHHSPEAV